MTLFGLRKRMNEASKRNPDLDVVIVDYKNRKVYNTRSAYRMYDKDRGEYVIVLPLEDDGYHKYDSLYREVD